MIANLTPGLLYFCTIDFVRVTWLSTEQLRSEVSWHAADATA